MFGVGVILQTSAVLFMLVKLLGAGYLIYLGIRKYKSKDVFFPAINQKRCPKKNAYLPKFREGFLSATTADKNRWAPYPLMEPNNNMIFLELKIPPVLIFVICGMFMWLTSLVTNGVGIDPKIRFFSGIILLMTGGYIAGAGMIGFRKAKTTVSPLNPNKTSSLVCSGIYQHTRNPMYLGLLFCLFSWTCFLDNLFSIIFIIFYLLYMTQFQIKPEERILVSIFGDNYKLYKKKVRRWF